VRFKTTLVLLAVFAALLAVVLFFESKGKKDTAAKDKESVLVDLAASDIQRIELKKADGTITLEKDDQGGWRMTSPFEAKADATEADGLASSFAGLRIDRVVENEAKDIKTYEIPRTEVSLWVKGKSAPVRVLVGMENPLDKSLFAKREDDPRVVLLASSLTATLDKKAFDFRDKTIFKFETAKVKKIRVQAKDRSWEAAREGNSWLFTAPFRALAEKSKLDSLIESLSDLKATEFLSEDKKPADVRRLGLEKPEYMVTLSLPAANKEVAFSLHKDAAKSYAASSDSTKIVAFDGALFADLEKKADELREKKVADFASWEADRVAVKSRGLTLAAAKEKVKDAEQWLLDTAAKDAADGLKVEAFIRRIEGLEAAAFIDNPKSLAEFGLDKPAAEVRIRTKDVDNKAKETVILVGKEDAAKKQVVVKNAGLDYLFRVDASFLADIPKEAKDWKAEPPVAAEPADKKK
jgi:hypothetical protein